MKKKLQALINAALNTLQTQGKLSVNLSLSEISIERAREPSRGDFACNAAMLLSKKTGSTPKDLAELIVAALPPSNIIKQASIAHPGFINFFISEKILRSNIHEVLTANKNYGCSSIGQGKRICIEFVSANPTGPLHVGHGRGAAQGASLSNLLGAVGFTVHREYYVNDAGRQMHILALSVWLRYLEICKLNINFPHNAYKGDYVITIAQLLYNQLNENLKHDPEKIFSPLSNNEENNEDSYIDELITRAQHLLGNDYKLIFSYGLNYVLKDIKRDLEEFGVHFDNWFTESSLVENGAINRGIELLRAGGHLYEQGGALWFKSTDFGDDKDRVLVRENGQHTYFAADVAYHLYKYEQGYDRMIDVFGADHHGYIPRIHAFLKASGRDPNKLDVLLVQFAILYRGKERISMSTRGGQFVTLRELREEVGVDAARFFYVLRKLAQHLDFDLELAKSHSNDNPVYYIQYAHARICSVFRQLESKQQTWDPHTGLAHLDRLTTEQERNLLLYLLRYPETVESSALQYEPHQLAYYLQELAHAFHAYYNNEQFLVEDEKLRHARLHLISAVRQVLANGLGLLGVNSPETM